MAIVSIAFQATLQAMKTGKSNQNPRKQQLLLLLPPPLKGQISASFLLGSSRFPNDSRRWSFGDGGDQIKPLSYKAAATCLAQMSHTINPLKLQDCKLEAHHDRKSSLQGQYPEGHKFKEKSTHWQDVLMNRSVHRINLLCLAQTF